MKMVTTLVLTRKPDEIFQSTYKKGQQGRFGTLLVLSGPKITTVKVGGKAGSTSSIMIPAGALEFTTEGEGAVTELKRFTTIERMGGYVQLKPQEFNGKTYKKEPYGITYEVGNPAVAELDGTGGKCFRVHGGTSKPELGILIHEAPQVGWLIGCIGPRKLNDKNTSETRTARPAMAELFSVSPRPSQLFVLDW